MSARSLRRVYTVGVTGWARIESGGIRLADSAGQPDEPKFTFFLFLKTVSLYAYG